MPLSRHNIQSTIPKALLALAFSTLQKTHNDSDDGIKVIVPCRRVVNAYVPSATVLAGRHPPPPPPRCPWAWKEKVFWRILVLCSWCFRSSRSRARSPGRTRRPSPPPQAPPTAHPSRNAGQGTRTHPVHAHTLLFVHGDKTGMQIGLLHFVASVFYLHIYSSFAVVIIWYVVELSVVLDSFKLLFTLTHGVIKLL
jgi:hypothetical protein